MSDVDFASAPAKQKEAPQGREESRSVTDPLTELLRPHVSPLDFGRAAALHRHERTPERDLESDLLLGPLWSVRLALEQVESSRQVTDRFAGRAPLRGDLGGQAQISDRPTEVAAPFEVHGQLGRDLDGTLTQAGFESHADAAVQLHSASRRDALVDDFLMERVVETVSSSDRPVRPRIGAE